MLTISNILCLTALAAASASAAEFSVNINFSDGATGRGTFTTNSSFTGITAWNFAVTGGDPTHDFTTSSNTSGGATIGAPSGCGVGDVQQVGFFNNPFTAAVNICLSTKLDANGAQIDAATSTSCDLSNTCGTGTSGSIFPFVAQIGYAANLKAGDARINLTNVGAVSGSEGAGDICANVYVFEQDQQLIACCTCPLTPNHLQNLSVQGDLVSNPLTPGVPSSITTLLIASSGACDASNPGPVVDSLRAWETTFHAAPGGGFALTETPFSSVALSDSEFAKATQTCGFIKANGTGFGICGSCTLGAAGANRK